MLCKICGNSDQNRVHAAREMMLGLGDEFSYIECSKCGCVQLAQIPKDMSRYYPEKYYSYAKQGSLSFILRRHRAFYASNGINPVGALTAYFYGPDNAIHSVSRLELRKDARVLDVGCGSGELVLNLQRMGFMNLTGLDPFLPSSTETAGVRLLKRELFEFEGEFDVVMLHHTFEHLAEPALVLAHLNRILSSNGTIILRIPLSDSYAWNYYALNWHQLDAPRHFFLHTNRSMAVLAKMAHLSISEVIYDSTLMQFVISEEYLRGISQLDQRSYTRNPLRSIFSLHDVRAFRRQARRLNQSKDGDSACFYLRKL